MLLASIFETFVNSRPVAVMARFALQRLFDADRINEIFLANATRQYERVIPFSDVVSLVSQVVLRKQPSLATYQSLDIPHAAMSEVSWNR